MRFHATALRIFSIEKTACNLIILAIDIDPLMIKRTKKADQYGKNIFYSSVNVIEYNNDKENDCIANHVNSYEICRFDIVCCSFQ